MTAKRNVLTTAIVVGSTISTVGGVPVFRKRQIVLYAAQDLPIVVLVVNMYMSTSTYQDIVRHSIYLFNSYLQIKYYIIEYDDNLVIRISLS